MSVFVVRVCVVVVVVVVVVIVLVVVVDCRRSVLVSSAVGLGISIVVGNLSSLSRDGNNIGIRTAPTVSRCSTENKIGQ